MPDQPTVLLLSSNGAGMGHLTRLLAYGRRMPGVRRHVVSLSQAVPAVAAEGVTWEYIPSQGSTGLRAATWRSLFADRMTELMERVDPDVLVFDGTHPYRGLDVALDSYPHTRAVWSRRGMWKPGRNVDQLEKSSWFSAVVEPGDLSAVADRGATAQASDAVRVRPVTLMDREDLTSRDEARAALGLPAEGPLALVALGAGNINDTRDEVGAAAAALRARGIGVCVTAPAIAERAYQSEGLHVVSHFPLSEHFAAFDHAIAAAGYNSFHELLRFGIPTILVPNDHTSLDDQVTRAEHAAAAGWALSTRTLVGGSAARLVDELIARGPELAAKAQEDDPGNGAADAAAAVLAAGGLR